MHSWEGEKVKVLEIEKDHDVGYNQNALYKIVNFSKNKFKVLFRKKRG